MSDVGPYGTTQNPDADAVTADALVGERVSPVVGNSLAGTAALFSTAPYVPPKPPTVDIAPADVSEVCRYRNCRQARSQGFLYCDRHLT